ncbi:TonB family protein [Hymenobacter jejuensis]|uniref:TonB family protein n=1 Tax=Hymenobacter jejuensis TaxID=2502781 RepID=A0A5B7ZZ13_9BACT|nr:TonB family protein [Hymenobacter jejuensis]QDA60230.1 TonB family protein [Hymenobacter jejuensis]
MPNYYQVLGVPTSASAEQIKQAYRLYAKHLHPDRHHNTPFFTERFREVQEAYEVLTDPIRRRSHDISLRPGAIPSALIDRNAEQALRARLSELEKQLRHTTHKLQHANKQLAKSHKIQIISYIAIGIVLLVAGFLLLRTPLTEQLMQEPYEAISYQLEPALPADTTLPNNTYTAAEVMPRFPGGTRGLLKYINAQIEYPPQALHQGVQGKVFVSFVVDKAGWVRDIRIVKGLGSGTDEETERVLHLLPRFIPGYQNHIPVNVAFTMPITFRLE